LLRLVPSCCRAEPKFCTRWSATGWFQRKEAIDMASTAAAPSQPPLLAPGATPSADHHQPLRAEIFGIEHLEAHAEALAAAPLAPPRTPGLDLPHRLRQIGAELEHAYRRITGAARQQTAIGSDAEWLLDNFHIVEDNLREVRHDLPGGYFKKLPKLASGSYAGLPRVYVLGLELIAHTDSALDEATITRVVEAYQRVAPLTIGELWAVPIMLRLGLLDNLARLGRHMLSAWDQRCEADEWKCHFLACAGRELEQVGHYLLHPSRRPRANWSDPFVVRLIQVLRDHGPELHSGTAWLEEHLRSRDLEVMDIVRREHQRQAANQVSVGNCVTSLRLLSALDWMAFFEQTSAVEVELRRDPVGVYARQDFATRDRYRRRVEELAEGSRLSELEVARRAVARAGQATADTGVERHVGTWLVGPRRGAFEKELAYRPRWGRWLLDGAARHASPAYFGALAALTVVLVAGAVSYAGNVLELDGGLAWSLLALVAAAVALPASELAVGLAHHAITLVVPPRVLPKMDFKAGIPADCVTFVVIPSLLTSADSAANLLERLEIHYLSNPDPHLTFALLTDFIDAEVETSPEDEAWQTAALAGVRALNAKYAPHGPDRFFLFHRRRQWNAVMQVWMGWERKRGKLSEFNRLLRGARDTSFTTMSCEPAEVPRVRFVITLDTDTKLSRDTARRLVATLAHPLNRARFDPERGRVVEGYAVLQPRVSLTLASASKTWFARIFAGSAGTDPYTTAVSDVYMDLFGRGSYTGKGIYEVDAFEAAAGGTFPDNHILSHDLIEGNYARCGLVTDIEVLDDFPTVYTAFARREHRWVRGDWQILPWLYGRVPAPEGKRRNPLPALERWKVFDNLRRSLVPPALVLLLVLGWTVLPGSAWFWTAVALSVPLLPLAQVLFSTTVSFLRGPSWTLPWLALRSTVAATAAQAGLSVVLLGNQALLTADAVVRTWARLFISRQHLLEWETSASTERRLGTRAADFVRMMWPASALAVTCALAVALVQPAALVPAAPLLLAWLVSPLVAWRLSCPRPQIQETLTAQDRLAVRRLARKTWLYFETFVTAEDHWLPPDNYQEDPKNVVAHRTSPTNMGLYLLSSLAAHDLGYLTLPALLDRLENTLDTFGQLATHHGHFFNWYDIQSLKPLPPEYVSTVDSGNLLGCLLALEQGLRAKAAQPWSRQPVRDGLADTLRLLAEAVAALEPPPGRDQEGPHPLQQAVIRLQGLLELLPGDLAGERLWLEKLHQEARELTAEEGHLAGLLRETPEELQRWAERFAELVAQRRAELAGCQGDGAARMPPAWAERCHQLADCAAALAAGMDFRFLYNDKRELLSIGWNHAAGQLDKAHYDLLASEASLTSFLAVARGEAPRQHWFHLGRPLTRVAGGVTLVSWGGSMFEYLMPRLLLKPYAGTLLAESWQTAVDRHIEYGRQHRVPWGSSESGFSALDGRLDYQYQSFGVPGLGLKRGLGKDLVIAPYATALALAERPHAAAENFRRLADAGAEGAFGLYEALDYARERGRRQQPDLVRSYMAHHQGMTLVAMANCLLDDVMPRRLRAWPAARANEVLLQERVPALVPLVTPHSDEAAPPVVRDVPSLLSRRMTTAHTPHPRTHLLSNGRYSVMLTNAGAGWSTWKDLAVLRWREDRTRDRGGQFCYVRELRSGRLWSAAHHPVCQHADSYEVIFSTDKAEYHRRDGDVATHWEITVSPENDAEVRRVSFTNHGELAVELEVTSYGEVVLAPHRADLAHPAFGKLFLETEFLPSQRALLCRRRPRSSDQKPLWAVHVLAVDAAPVNEIQCETDRARFLGRGRTVRTPAACDGGARLSGTTGAVLDPVLSLCCRLRVPADGSVSLAFTTAVAETREQAVAIADQYHDLHSVTRAFELAWAHSQVELRHLKMSPEDAHLCQRLAGYVLFAGPVLRDAEAVTANRLGAASLWALGISGDLPIVLLRIDASDQLPLARLLLQAHAYWRLKGLAVDLVLLNEHPPSYQAELHQQLQELVRGSDSHALADKPGGVFVRQAPQIPEHIQTALLAAARVVLSGAAGSLAAQVDRQEEAPELPAPLRPPARPERRKIATPPRQQLQFDNGTGGFSADGREYVLHLPGGTAGLPPTPWCNVIANPSFGFLISETGGGFTWAGNSQMNRLTGWNNDPVADPPSEVLYLRDDRTGEVWTPTPLPRGTGPTTVRHGQGYTVFEQRGDGLEQELLVLVPPADPIKLLRLKVRNTGKQLRRLTAVFYAEWVLGTLREQAALQVVCAADETTGALLAHNYWNADFANQVAFAATTERPVTFTADRGEFLGRNGTLALPAALGRVKLSGRVEPLADPCAALMAPLEIPAGAEREVVFFLGQAGSIEEVQRLLVEYRKPACVEQALADVRRMWDDILGSVQVRTPDAAFDLMLNRWLLYQVLSCRVWGRSALYQSGGAYGFRDQLQDVMGLVHGAPQEVRAQILRAAAHQFKEGDVQHWWHPPAGRGVRTRFSDDLLWLPLVACHYVNATGDAGVLDEQVPFLQGPLLRPDQEEDYGLPTITQETASVYDHCVRALEHGYRLGEHGLPLMGTGDWNDGMNRVGAEGKGESVWVAWFLIIILRDFAAVADTRGDAERAVWCRKRGEQLRAAVEQHAWDGEWYLRAYFDNGMPLGSHANDECRIDSIVQSWAVLSGVAEPERCTRAMAALEQQLVRDKDRLILLFAPPFDQGKLQPGYIKGYLPGIRENGGQYTHAATWVVLATALLGKGTRAKELFDLLSPIPSAATPQAVAQYKVEPYVLAADVYSLPPHVGRGGWTWYTGSAGWLHRVGLEYLLGCRRQCDRLHVEPCVPANWQGFEVEWRHGSATYHVSVKNPRGVERGVTRVTVDGQSSHDGTIPLADDGQRHEVVVEMG
jgi:cyclic beta-1,2-glucan synthetase